MAEIQMEMAMQALLKKVIGLIFLLAILQATVSIIVKYYMPEVEVPI